MADYISTAFEPAWESVRAAPLVTLDFGDGHVVRRTLQGNVATYICLADGTVVDVLPGIYDQPTYVSQLDKCARVAEACRTAPAQYQGLDLTAFSTRPATGAAVTVASMRAGQPQPAELYQNTIRQHHLQESKRLADAPVAATLLKIAETGGMSKSETFPRWPAAPVPAPKLQAGAGFGGIEGPTQRAILGLPAPAESEPPPPADLAAWSSLKLDAQANELVRRKAVHDKLATLGAVRPDDIKKWLFKEVLHADLDDPYLGLEPLLTDNYPFAAEDRAAQR